MPSPWARCRRSPAPASAASAVSAGSPSMASSSTSGAPPALVAALHRAPQRAIEIRMRLLEIADDLEVHALHLRKIDLLDVDEPQQLAHGLRHLAAALVARAAALRDADLGPELFLVEPEPPPDLAGIEDAVEEFHGVDRLRLSLSLREQGSTCLARMHDAIPMAYFSPKWRVERKRHSSGWPAPPLQTVAKTLARSCRAATPRRRPGRRSGSTGTVLAV